MKSQSKYRNVKCTYKLMRFDSLGERDRYKQLELIEKSGEISHLQRQVKFKIDVNGHKICTYIADYSYWNSEGYVVEDFKGKITDSYRLKKKLMKAVHGIEILETRKK